MNRTPNKILYATLAFGFGPFVYGVEATEEEFKQSQPQQQMVANSISTLTTSLKSESGTTRLEAKEILHMEFKHFKAYEHQMMSVIKKLGFDKKSRDAQNQLKGYSTILKKIRSLIEKEDCDGLAKIIVGSRQNQIIDCAYSCHQLLGPDRPQVAGPFSYGPITEEQRDIYKKHNVLELYESQINVKIITHSLLKAAFNFIDRNKISTELNLLIYTQPSLWAYLEGAGPNPWSINWVIGLTEDQLSTASPGHSFGSYHDVPDLYFILKTYAAGGCPKYSFLNSRLKGVIDSMDIPGLPEFLFEEELKEYKVERLKKAADNKKKNERKKVAKAKKHQDLISQDISSGAASEVSMSQQLSQTTPPSISSSVDEMSKSMSLLQLDHTTQQVDHEEEKSAFADEDGVQKSSHAIHPKYFRDSQVAGGTDKELQRYTQQQLERGKTEKGVFSPAQPMLDMLFSHEHKTISGHLSEQGIKKIPGVVIQRTTGSSHFEVKFNGKTVGGYFRTDSEYCTAYKDYLKDIIVQMGYQPSKKK